MSAQQPVPDPGVVAAWIAGALVARRRILRLPARALHERTVELGFPISRNTITNVENGRRESITVHEVLVLAAALDMPPGDLLGLPRGAEYRAGIERGLRLAHGAIAAVEVTP